MNLRQIEAFKLVMESGTVTCAAEAMHVSQPAVTKLLQAFERAAGFKVFNRAQGRLIPTPEGLLLYRDVDRVFAAADEIRRSARDILAMRKGALSVGAMPALSTGFVQQVAAAFMAAYPNVNIALHTAPRTKLVDMLLSGKLDVALCHSVDEHPEVETELLSRDPAVCILPPGHRLTKKQTISARDLAGEDFISWSEGTLTRARVDAVFEKLGIARTLRFSASTSPSICAYVANGLGVAILHPLYVGTAAHAVALRRFMPKLEVDLLIAYSRQPERPRLVRAFRDLAARQAGALVKTVLAD
ncbi:MAG: LysR family transcriptional regulator [Rhodospirillaceae bacterium]